MKRWLLAVLLALFAVHSAFGGQASPQKKTSRSPRSNLRAATSAPASAIASANARVSAGSRPQLSAAANFSPSWKAELEAQANHGREIGLRGLEELRKLSELAKVGKIELEYVGTRPNLDQIKLAGGGEIDAMIRDVALELGASFLTSDQVQSRVAEAMGLDVEYVRPQREPIKSLSLEKYFTEDTLSVHLKEGAVPMAKRGRVGEAAPATQEFRAIAGQTV